MSTAPEQKLETNVEIGTLFAFYGGLLTQKQQQALSLHYDEDFSLGEIAEQFDVSRQSVHELITRSADKLRGYEAALGLARRMEETWLGLRQAQGLLEQALTNPLPPAAAQAVTKAKGLIGEAISKQEEDGHGI